jgi:N-acetyl-alpha-D-muramate 1-phosphate uridylyltransferase
MQCVILAGGLGTRIRDRAGDLPKALIPVLGKPFAFYQLEWLARQNIGRVVMSVGYRGDMIAEAVGDGSRFGLQISYANEGDQLRGTGGALRFLADLALLDPGFFILYGDSYLPIELAPIWKTSGQGSFCTMAVMRNKDRWDRSNVVFKDGRVVLYDKSTNDPAGAGMQYIDYGVSVLTREVVLDMIAAGEVTDLAPLLKRLSTEGRLRGYKVSERFYEIGSPQGLDDFEAYLSKQ